MFEYAIPVLALIATIVGVSKETLDANKRINGFGYLLAFIAFIICGISCFQVRSQQQKEEIRKKMVIEKMGDTMEQVALMVQLFRLENSPPEEDSAGLMFIERLRGTSDKITQLVVVYKEAMPDSICNAALEVANLVSDNKVNLINDKDGKDGYLRDLERQLLIASSLTKLDKDTIQTWHIPKARD